MSALPRILSIAAALLLAFPAQSAPPPAISQIVVSGQGDVLLDPDSAAFEITITTRGVTSAAAATENARITQEVRGALDHVKLPREDLKDSRLSVSARWDYDANAERRPKLAGYEARNTLRIRTQRIESAGGVIDAVLAAGASGVSEPVYEAKNLPDARRRALALAVAEARLDAEAIAKASGGRLGALLQLASDPQEGPAFQRFGELRMATMAAPAQPTQLLPGQIRVAARVSAQWQFLPGDASR